MRKSGSCSVLLKPCSGCTLTGTAINTAMKYDDINCEHPLHPAQIKTLVNLLQIPCALSAVHYTWPRLWYFGKGLITSAVIRIRISYRHNQFPAHSLVDREDYEI